MYVKFIRRYYVNTVHIYLSEYCNFNKRSRRKTELKNTAY